MMIWWLDTSFWAAGPMDTMILDLAFLLAHIKLKCPLDLYDSDS